MIPTDIHSGCPFKHDGQPLFALGSNGNCKFFA